ncbi:MAG: hypothetical protein JWP36_975 [Paucimonas sp.]|nr:hypothetical protein [Paucimonas sp.]
MNTALSGSLPGSLHPTKAISFEDFRRLAIDPSLSEYERIGFPDDFRSGRDDEIFADIRYKLPALEETGRTILDIGPGCSRLPRILIDLCEENSHRLLMIDSEEMLEQLPERPFLTKVTGMFPDCPELLATLKGRTDLILCYSVLQCIMADMSVFRFLDLSLSLLAPGGRMLIGDVPNASKRRRFFASETGIRFHQAYTGTDDLPDVAFNRLGDTGAIDDAVVSAVLQRARLAGFDAYVMPQGPGLPMSNRREDILIVRP